MTHFGQQNDLCEAVTKIEQIATNPAWPSRRGRRALFRLLAVVIGVSPFLITESVLRFTDWGRPQDVGDPFVGFSEVRPLFVLNDRGDRYQIPKSRQAFFQPEGFAAKKRPSEFRIFCLGGSTVQGRPYSIETSFTTWLELSLQVADTSREWEVVNCGGVSYASYRLVPIMKEVLAHEPDLFIVYTGHNEFLEERSYGSIKRMPAWTKGIGERLLSLRTYNLARRLWYPSGDSSDDVVDRAELAVEVDALLDYQGGLEVYHRDDRWRAGVIEHFEHNLRRLVRIARRAQIPLLLVNPVCNLKDTPPFKTEHRHGLSEQQIATFKRLWESAKSLDWKLLDQKASVLNRALEIDARYADAHFLLARCYDAMGLSDQAKAEYIRAKEEDICPLRILEPMHDVIMRVARQTRTPLVNVRQSFEEATRDGIPGDDSLIDHVHPRIEGHQLIAQLLFDEMVHLGLATQRVDWKTERDRLYAEHMGSLGASYFPTKRRTITGSTTMDAGAGVSHSCP